MDAARSTLTGRDADYRRHRAVDLGPEFGLRFDGDCVGAGSGGGLLAWAIWPGRRISAAPGQLRVVTGSGRVQEQDPTGGRLVIGQTMLWWAMEWQHQTDTGAVARLTLATWQSRATLEQLAHELATACDTELPVAIAAPPSRDR